MKLTTDSGPHLLHEYQCQDCGKLSIQVNRLKKRAFRWLFLNPANVAASDAGTRTSSAPLAATERMKPTDGRNTSAFQKSVRGTARTTPKEI